LIKFFNGGHISEEIFHVWGALEFSGPELFLVSIKIGLGEKDPTTGASNLEWGRLLIKIVEVTSLRGQSFTLASQIGLGVKYNLTLAGVYRVLWPWGRRLRLVCVSVIGVRGIVVRFRFLLSISSTFYDLLLRWYSFAKKLQSQTVIREIMQTLLLEKAARKMLMKLKPVGNCWRRN